jgi:Dolichyl-phosphate-mannose-protein mannosyltransferase
LLASAAALVIAVGAAIRLWGLARQPLNADEAVVGLMAHEILRGHLSAFFWGQRYGGAEAYAVAGVFALFGQSPFSLGLTPVLLDAIAAILVWRIGRRLFCPTVGVLAALLFWIWPEVYVQLSILEFGFRWLALVCGLVMLLESLRITDATPMRAPLVTRADWALLGLALGVGWWSTPEIAYYALPALGLLAFRALRCRIELSPVNVAIAFAAAVAGAAPWLWDNVRRGLPSLHERRHSLAEFARHLRDLGTHVLPMAFGLRLRLSGAWVISPAAGQALYALVLVVMALLVAHLVIERRALVLVAFCALSPIEYAAAPTNSWGDGRYSVYFAPVVALLVAGAAIDGAAFVLGRLGAGRAPGIRAEVLGSVLVVLCALALTLGSLPRLSPYRVTPLVASEASWTESHSNPNGWLAPVLSSLLGAAVHDLYAGYWVGTVLDFDSHGALTTTDLPFSRYPPYTRAVESSPRAAWLFLNPVDAARVKAETATTLVDPGCNSNHRGCLALPIFENYLRKTGDGFETETVGDFISVLPDRPVQIAAFLADVRRWH